MSRRALVIYIQHFFIARMTYPSNRSYLSGNMENKNAIIVAVVAVIVVIAAVGAYYMIQDGGEHESPEADTYYVYLDGMGDVNGWHTGMGSTPYEGITAAFDNDEITYDIGDDGWVSDIAGYAYDGTNGFGVFVYTSTSTENPYVGYFCAGPVITDVTGNIIYVSYGPYDANYNSTLNPETTSDDSLMSTGPFVDEGYAPLEYDDNYYIYLDGMGDIDGWYEGTGASAVEGVKDALNGHVEYDIGDDGWLNSIADFAYDGTNGFGIFVYTSTTLENPYAGYFGAGPTFGTIAGNIIYVSFGPFDDNYDSELTPSSTTSDVMSTGPFAA